jgi:NTE family protein
MARALVLSAGGFFGAYQVGAWQTLCGHYHPDLVVGASIGSLNGCAIAGGAAGDELASIWAEATSSARLRFRLGTPVSGYLDPATLETWAKRIFHQYPPGNPRASADCVVVVTQWTRLRPRMFRGRDITWRHLAASCAVPLLLPQQRLNGSLYSDGGLLRALPVWAALELGATEILAINVWPGLPWPLATMLRGLRRVSGFREPPWDARIELLEPAVPLGPLRNSIDPSAAHVERWMELGRHDAAARLAAIRALEDTPATGRDSASTASG